jgi:hypothetical protein
MSGIINLGCGAGEPSASPMGRRQRVSNPLDGSVCRYLSSPNDSSMVDRREIRANVVEILNTPSPVCR